VSQLARTGIFAAAAVAAIALAVVASIPKRFGTTADHATELLFPDFQDPLSAQSMEIVKFDEDTSTRHEFKIGNVNGTWRITSHDNYPADKNTQLSGAASALVACQRGSQISSERSQHGTYQVLDPTEEAPAGQRGMGTLVAFTGESEKKLAELIVGKEVADQPDQPDPNTKLHYVRIRGQDAVYQVALDARKFSTKFDDWIERDLLKMDTSRIKSITIRDLDIAGNRLITKGFLHLTHKDSAHENRWGLDDLGPEEKLDEAKLNDLRNALSDLKIVDVHPKPAVLAAMLSGKNKQDVSPIEQMQAEMSLKQHGFITGSFGILPSDGFVEVQMEDGLVYTVLFGGIASLTADQNEAKRKEAKKKEDEKEGEKEGDEGEKKDNAVGTNRYVFVDIAFVENLIPKPEIKPIPGEPLLPKELAVEKAKQEAGAKENAKPAAKPKKVTLADTLKELRRLDEEGLVDAAELEHQRKNVERDNQRAQEEYDSQVKAAQKKEKELKERFADWYYVIDNDVYRKIRVKRAEIVKGPEKPKDEKAKDGAAKGEAAKGEKSKDSPAKATGAKAGTP
jgi:hypothetical protein